MKQINRGTIVTLAGLGVNLTLGVLYAWGVISAALIDKLGWSATQTQIPYMMACACFAFSMVPGGRLQDKFGPRPIIMAAAVLAGVGFYLAGATLTVVGLTLFFGLVFGIGMGMGYAAPTPAAVKWFGPEKRGLISGIVVSGFGLAPIYIAPLTSSLIQSYGIQTTFYILGGLFFVVIMSLAQFISNPPAGYVAPSSGKVDVKKSTAGRNYEAREMLGTSQFYLLWTMFCFGTFAGLLIIGQLAKIGLEQAGMTTAFTLTAIYAFFNFAGRIAWGVISDRLGRQQSLFVAFLLQVITYIAFPYLATPVALVAGIAIVGFTFGGMLTLFPSMTADYYGMKNFGLNYGFVITAWGIGGVLGPLVGGMVRDATGTYVISYGVSAVLSLLGVVLSLAIKAPGTTRSKIFGFATEGD
jgi:OFA family oxalate/formate antiporter-like MFS transporter